MRWATSSISSRSGCWVQLGCAVAVILRPLGRQVERHLREVVGDHLTGRHVDDRGHRDALRVVRDAGEVRVLQPRDLQHRVDTAGVEVEGPAAFVVRRPAEADGQHVFQAEQATHDDRAVGPRAGPRDDQPISTGFDGIAVTTVRGDAGGDVVGVAVELAAVGDICHASSMPLPNVTLPRRNRADLSTQ